MIDQTLGSALRAAFRERGLSLRAAAEAMHYDPGYLSRVLSGKQPLSQQLAKSLDELLGVTNFSALAVVANSDAASRVERLTENPSRVDAEGVTALTRTLWEHRLMDDSLGSGATLSAMRGTLPAIYKAAKDSRGPHRTALLTVAAEWTQFTGWLYAAERKDVRASEVLTRAEEIADEANAPTLAAIATSFKGYIARQQRQGRRTVRYAMAALHTPDAHTTQNIFDMLQAAQGYAVLGARDAAVGLLNRALPLVEREIEPPQALYWYRRPFFLLNSGMAFLELGERREAAEHLREGLAGLPEDQKDAHWIDEYRAAFHRSEQGA